MTPAERKLRSQKAAHQSWGQTPDRSARTALDAKFLEAADGDPIRAEHLRKAYFAGLALKSARSRRLSRELTAQATEAETELDALGGVNDVA